MSHYSQGIDTRDNILANALQLFSKNGYDATSVAEICEQTQVSKGAFYHHFPSKQELFLALMTSWLGEVDGTLQAAGDLAKDVPGSLEKMAATTGQLFEELEGGFPILLEFWRQASRKPEIWERAVAPFRYYLTFFVNLVQKGVEEKDFDDTVDPEISARILMAMAMGLLLQASFDHADVDWQATTESGINMILRGMRRKT